MLDNPDNIAEAGNTSSSEETNPYGYPDWRDGAQYPFDLQTPIKEWKWEFIRRDEKYIELWINYGDHLIKENQQDKAWLQGREKAISKFGLDQLPDPNSKKHNLFFPNGNYSKRGAMISHEQAKNILTPLDFSEAESFALQAVNSGRLLVSIDIHFPLDKQIGDIKKAVKEWKSDLSTIIYEHQIEAHEFDENEDPSQPKEITKQEFKTFRPSANLLKSHLRLLDAYRELRASALTWEEIVNQFNTDSDIKHCSYETWIKDRKYDALDTQKEARHWPLSNSCFNSK